VSQRATNFIFLSQTLRRASGMVISPDVLLPEPFVQPCKWRQGKASVAQLVEQLIRNQ
jgi:hypothetical protein